MYSPLSKLCSLALSTPLQFQKHSRKRIHLTTKLKLYPTTWLKHKLMTTLVQRRSPTEEGCSISLYVDTYITIHFSSSWVLQSLTYLGVIFPTCCMQLSTCWLKFTYNGRFLLMIHMVRWTAQCWTRAIFFIRLYGYLWWHFKFFDTSRVWVVEEIFDTIWIYILCKNLRT